MQKICIHQFIKNSDIEISEGLGFRTDGVFGIGK